jgi:hypothetical protein
MKIYREFLRDDTGAVTIDWVALTAGVLLLGIMVVYAIFNGGVAVLVNKINSALTGVDMVSDVGLTPALYDMQLASGAELPAGSVVTDVKANTITDAATGKDTIVSYSTTFELPGGTSVTTTEFGDALSVGTTVKSGMYFKLPGSDGFVTQASVTDT